MQEILQRSLIGAGCSLPDVFVVLLLLNVALENLEYQHSPKPFPIPKNIRSERAVLSRF